MKLMFVIFCTVLSSAAVFAQPTELNYFKKSYEESRLQFIATATESRLENFFSIQHLQFHQPGDTSLITDVVHLKSKQSKKNLLVINSGIHGIEGFTGSALQSWYINTLKSSEPTNDYLFIHALNPYGFKNMRRVDIRNVDLNRAFLIHNSDYETKNPAYAALNTFLNPAEKVRLGIFSRIGFIGSAAILIAKHSIESLRKAILVGQHEFPLGLYYGGSEFPYQIEMLGQIRTQILPAYQKIFVIDVHTGYGENGKLHVLANSQTQKSAPDLLRVFGSDRIDFGDKNKFYAVKGDLISYLESFASEKQKILGATFEFGTLDSQKTLGSIESLRRMVLENQKFNQGSNEKSAAQVDQLFASMFYPESPGWRQGVISLADLELKKIKTYLQEPR